MQTREMQSIGALGLVLRRDSLVNTFVKHASRRIDGKVVLVLLEDLNIIVRERLDLENVRDRIVGSVRRHLASSMWIEPGKGLELGLQNNQGCEIEMLAKSQNANPKATAMYRGRSALWPGVTRYLCPPPSPG